MEEQDNDDFKKICVKVIVKKEEKRKEIYLPYFELRKFDKSEEIKEILRQGLNERKEIEIEMAKGETIEGFDKFIYDFLGRDNKLCIYKDKRGTEEYIISKRFTDFYKIKIGASLKLQTYENWAEFIGSLLSTYTVRYVEELIIELLIDTSWDALILYKLKNKYNFIPSDLLEKKNILIRTDFSYNIKILSMFKYICYIYKYTINKQGEISYYYACTKIHLNDEKFKISISNPIKTENCNNRPCSDSFFLFDSNKLHNEKTEIFTYANYISFSQDGNYKLTDIYSTIRKNQFCPIFREKCTCVKIIDIDDCANEIYIPDNILKSLDENYYQSIKSGLYENTNYEIILTNDESYAGFIGFIEDFVNEQKYLSINHSSDIQKYVISNRFNHKNDYIKIVSDLHPNQIAILIKDTVNKKSTIYNDIAVLFLKSYSSSSFFYDIVLKNFNMFHTFLNNFQLNLLSDTIYDILVLSKFSSLILPTFAPLNKSSNLAITLSKNNCYNLKLDDLFLSSIDYSIFCSVIIIKDSNNYIPVLLN